MTDQCTNTPDSRPSSRRTVHSRPSSRRTVLRGAGALGVGAAGLLAACGSDTDMTPSATTSATPTAGPAASGTPTGTAVGPVGDVPVNGGKVYPEQQVVVTQPAEGTYKAFTSVCTHQACQVGGVAADKITCPCHGSAFSAEDGSVLNGPAARPLAAKTVAVADGRLYVS
jgi:Rieske Fe-S protein